MSAREAEARRMRLTSIRYVAPGIHLFEFHPLAADAVPPFTAGAHIDVKLPNGLIRQYSLVNPQGETHRYVVAVKRDGASRGGSAYLHEQLRVGAVLEVGAPRNNFALHEDASHSVFIAGGIGITPIVGMIRRLRDLGGSWELHYSVRQRDEAALIDEFESGSLHLHVDEERAGALLDIRAIVAAACPDAHLYCCGPAPMLQHTRRRPRRASRTGFIWSASRQLPRRPTAARSRSS